MRSLLFWTAILGLVGCSGSFKSEKSSPQKDSSAFSFTVLGKDGVSLLAPQHTMADGTTTFIISLPAGVSILSAVWDFGDGMTHSGVESSVPHEYQNAGVYNVSVTLLDSLGTEMTLGQKVNVIPYISGFECLSELSMDLPVRAERGTAITASVYVPSCLLADFSGVKFNFGDGSAPVNGQSVQHTYTVADSYTVTAIVSVLVGENSTLTLRRDIEIFVPVDPPPPVSTPCIFNGQVVAEQVTAFSAPSVPFGQMCAQEVRVCSSGVLSGSFMYSTCVVEPEPPPPPAPVPVPVPDPAPAPAPAPEPAPAPVTGRWVYDQPVDRSGPQCKDVPQASNGNPNCSPIGLHCWNIVGLVGIQSFTCR